MFRDRPIPLRNLRSAIAALLAVLAIAGVATASEPPPWRLLASTEPFPPAIPIPMGVWDPLRERVLAIDAGWFREALVLRAFEPRPAPRWSVVPVAGTPPLTRYLTAVVYDSQRDRFLVVGSELGQSVSVWAVTLSGTPAWEKVVTSGDPIRRYGHSAIYDPVRDEVVIFGGEWSETWSLALATGAWSRIATTGAQPPPREGHGALYDPERHRMVMFGGHWEEGGRIFYDDLWELSLGDSPSWSAIPVAGPRPGARSAFGTVYDPVRRRMLVHGGVNLDSGVEPDDLWALLLDDTPEWKPIVPADTLRGRSYPLDAYDPVADQLLACGGAGYPQTSALSLADPARWDALVPECCPLPSPGAHSGSSVLFDSRRDRFLVIGGAFSQADSATWVFRPEGERRWEALRTPGVPFSTPRQAVYDSLGDRLLAFDGWQVWASPAQRPGPWTELGPHRPTAANGFGPLGWDAGVALDTRRNRLIATGGYMPYPHSAGFSLNGVWALSLGSVPAWDSLGTLPTTAYGHSAVYDPVRDRLIVSGGIEVYDSPRTRRSHGAVVWSTPVDSALSWTRLSQPADAALTGSPVASVAYDARTGRLFLGASSTLHVRQVDAVGPWTMVAASNPTPILSNPIAYDPVREQILALFTTSPTVDAWALAVGTARVAVLASERTADAVTIRLRSVAAWGRAAVLERREEDSDWAPVGSITFDIDGTAAFTDRDVRAGHDYSYRVRVEDGADVWFSEAIFLPDPAGIQLSLAGTRPNPAIGGARIYFTLPATGPARLEVFDVHGRRRSSRDVGSLGPGHHSLLVPGSASWDAGLYYARLRRGGDVRTAKFVLLP